MKRVVNDRKVDELVIGYPIHMDGVVGKRAKEVDLFISELAKEFNLPVHRVDERLTSVAAADSIQRKPKGKKEENPQMGGWMRPLLV